MTRDIFYRLLAQRFGSEWAQLSTAQRGLVGNDFSEMLREEYDTPDDTMSNGIALENAEEAATEYCRRIGARQGNLLAYVRCLEVATQRTA